MEIGHISMVGNLSNFNAFELPINAFDGRLSHAYTSFGDVANLSAIHGVCSFTSIAENFL